MIEEEYVNSDGSLVPIYCCCPEPCTRFVDMSHSLPTWLTSKDQEDVRNASAMHCIPKTMSAMSPANGLSPLKRVSAGDIRERALPSHHATRVVVAGLTSEASRPQGPRLSPSSLDLGKPPLWDTLLQRGGMFLTSLERHELVPWPGRVRKKVRSLSVVSQLMTHDLESSPEHRTPAEKQRL